MEKKFKETEKAFNFYQFICSEGLRVRLMYVRRANAEVGNVNLE